jgi:hypothetical protein
VEFVVAQVQRGVDGLEGLEIDIDLALLAFGGDDFTAVDNEAIRGDFRVQLKTLLGRGDGRQDGKTIDTRFDIGGGTLACQLRIGGAQSSHVRILQPTSSRRERPGPWVLSIVSQAYSGEASGGGLRIMSEIMLVPLPRAASRRLMSFLTFQISMFFSASFA